MKVEVIKDKQPEEFHRSAHRRINNLKRKYVARKEDDCSIFTLSFPNLSESPTKNPFTWLFDRCCKEHPDIQTIPGVLGGYLVFAIPDYRLVRS